MTPGLFPATPTHNPPDPALPADLRGAPLDVVLVRTGRATTLRLDGEVDLSTMRHFATALAIGIGTGGSELELDLRGIRFIDGRGLDELARAARRAADDDVDVHVLPGTALGDLSALLGWPEEIRAGLADAPAADSGEDEGTSEDAGTGRAPLPLEVVVNEPQHGVVVLSPRGRIDDMTAILLGDATVAAVALAPDSLVVDLADVGSLTAGGVDPLLCAQATAGKSGIGLRLAGGDAQVCEVLDLADSGGRFQWYASVTEALGPPSVRPARPGRAGGRAGSRRHDEYEYLAPLLAERSRLPPDHPRQSELRAQLITGYLPVAKHIARKHLYRGENLDDLEQVATLGLINAVDRFDPARGVDFLSFAIPTINGEVQRHYRDRTSTIRVPRPIREVQSQVFQTVDEMSQSMGRAPTPSELARHLDLDVETVIEALQAAYETRYSSLDEPRSTDDPGASESTRFNHALGVVDPQLDLVEDRQSLVPLLDSLAEREREIVLLRFYGNMTQTEIAKRVGISQMHVSRLLAATLAQLREQLNAEG